jgi:hypothetical protein
MFEGSTGSREVSVRIVTMRDVVEAGLNEAASTAGRLWVLNASEGFATLSALSELRLRVTD